MLRRLAHQFIDVYARRVPYHRGKWRVIEGLLKVTGVEEMNRGKTFVVELHGIRWKLLTTCAIQRKLFYHGFIDIDESRELLARLQPGAVFFDIGAYFGWYSFLLAGRLGATAYAFEPLPANFEALAENRRLNESAKVQAFPMALSDQPGEVSFHVPSEGNRGTGRILQEGGQRVPATTLDAFVAEHGISRIDAMKIDVEGAEVRVLAGGRETLRKLRPIILIEINPGRLKMLGTDEGTLLKALVALDYDLYSVTRQGLEPFDGKQPAGKEYFNLICLPKKG